MLIFSDIGDKLWNLVNNHTRDIVVKLQPKASREINDAHRNIITSILLLDASNSTLMNHTLQAVEVRLVVG